MAAATALFASDPAKILTLAVLYVVTGRLGLFLAVPPGFATIIWPPSGIALGMLLMHGRKLWPGVLIGSFLLNAYTAQAFGADGVVMAKLPAAAGIAIGSTLQALAGWLLVRRFIGLPLRFNTFRDVARLFLLCGPLACVVAASAGVASLYLAGVMPVDRIAGNWLAWWAGDLFGIIVFLPIVLLAPGGRAPIEWRGVVLGRAPVLAVLLVLIPLGLTFYAWKIASQSAYDHSQEQFRALASESEKALLHRLDGYSSALIGASAYWQETPDVSPPRWRQYVAALDIAHNYPGINGLGWVQPVAKGGLPAYSAQMKQRGLGDFAIKRATPDGPHYIITFLEPFAANAQAIGLDLAFEPRRRQAAETARDTGKPAITRKIVLVQDREQRPGFLIYHPIYRSGATPGTVAGRREDLAGWIYAPFIASNLFADLTASQGATINLKVYDQGRETSENLIYSSIKERTPAAFTLRRVVTVGQSRWLIVWESTPQFESGSRYYNPIFILVGGLLFSGMFAIFVFVSSLRNGDTLRLLAGRHRFVLPAAVLIVLSVGSVFLYRTLVEQEGRFVHALVDKDYARIEQLVSDQSKAALEDLRNALPADLRNAYRVEVRDGGRTLVVSAPEGEVAPAWSASRTFVTGDRVRELRVTPMRAHIAHQSSIMPSLALIAGLLISALSALSVQTLVVLRQRSRELEHLHRRAADQANRTSTILNTVLDGVITIDAQGLIEDVNPAAERIFGYEGSELRGRNLAMLLPDPNWLNSNGSLAMFELGHKHNLGLKRELRGLRRDGVMFAVELTVNEMELQGRRLFVCTVKDISERKHAEDLKRAQHQQIESIARMLENSVNEIFILDLATLNFLQVNRGGRENLGYTLEELRGMTPLDVTADMAPETYHGLIGGLMNGRDDKVVFGARHRRKNGSVYDAEVHIQEGTYEGRPALFQIVLDVTERKSRDEALRNSEETFRSAMENASIGMALVDPSGRWLKVNAAACDLLGYSAEELLSNDFQSLTAPEDLEADMALVGRALSGEISSYVLEKRYIRKDGGIVWAMLTVSLVRDSARQPRYFISQIQDITERKEMERLKSEFISVVSHELRTPLTAIRGSLGLLAGFGANLPEKAMRMVELARKNCERLIPLINDILDIDRIASGQMRLDLRDEAVAGLVARSVEANQPYAQRFGVTLTLAAVDPALRIAVDAARFEQALTNLLSNAAKFSSSGQSVEITVTEAEGKARIAVRDHGQGISDEFRQRIFSRFSQADSSSTRSHAGTGLGLHITRGIVEHMGGEIGFDSEPGVGSTFWLAFPVLAAVEKRPAA